MGSKAYVPAAGSFGTRQDYNSDIYSKIHRVQVIDVKPEDGTVQVSFLNLAVETSATIPLLGLSLPPSPIDITVVDYTSTAWGRYIPQVGDIMIGAYGSDGTLHLFGYSAVSYGGYEVADQSKESKGGIGWGVSSGKRVKPGDWDFKSSRGCMFYMGEKVNLSSSNCLFSLSQNTQDITTTAPLLLGSANSSMTRYGAVRRQVLPTDKSESYINPAAAPMPVRSPTDTAQEFTVDLRWGSGKTSQPPGGSLAYMAMGDVVDDLNPAVEAIGYSLLDSSDGNPVRYIFRLPGASPTLATYVETVDSLGNYLVETPSSTATSFKWDTPTAAWEISNLSTSLTSTTTVSLDATTTMALTGTAGFTASSDATATLNGGVKAVVSSDALVYLGKSDGLTDRVVKGDAWFQWVSEVLTLLMTHFHPSPVGPTAQDPVLVAQIPLKVLAAQNVLSTKVWTE